MDLLPVPETLRQVRGRFLDGALADAGTPWQVSLAGSLLATEGVVPPLADVLLGNVPGATWLPWQRVSPWPRGRGEGERVRYRMTLRRPAWGGERPSAP